MGQQEQSQQEPENENKDEGPVDADFEVVDDEK
jgi:hypothetical protein